MKDKLLTLTTVSDIEKEMRTLISSNPTTKYRLNIVEWKTRRSLSANAVQHLWYSTIAAYTGDNIRNEANRCKRDFGLPILLSDSDINVKLSWMLDNIKFHKMTDRQQIEVMDLIQVTSIMNTQQHKLYRDNIQSFWNERGLEIDYNEIRD